MSHFTTILGVCKANPLVLPVKYNVEHSYYSGDLYYTPMKHDSTSYYVKMRSMQISNYKDSLEMDTSSYTVYIDSGTTLMIVPVKIYDQIQSKFKVLCNNDIFLNSLICGQINIFDLKEEKCKYFDKSVFSKLPDIKFKFPEGDNVSFFEVTISPQDYIRFFPSDKTGFDYCGQFGITTLALDDWGTYFDQIILGDTFMRGSNLPTNLFSNIFLTETSFLHCI